MKYLELKGGIIQDKDAMRNMAADRVANSMNLLSDEDKQNPNWNKLL